MCYQTSARYQGLGSPGPLLSSHPPPIQPLITKGLSRHAPQLPFLASRKPSRPAAFPPGERLLFFLLAAAFSRRPITIPLTRPLYCFAFHSPVPRIKYSFFPFFFLSSPSYFISLLPILLLSFSYVSYSFLLLFLRFPITFNG